ncbi:hypothetical protein CC80DRAFT_425467, partial [Byssothecium circinans]
RKRMLGDEHPSTLTSMANLALTYGDQGRWKEAEELEVQVMETRKRDPLAQGSDDLVASSRFLKRFFEGCATVHTTRLCHCPRTVKRLCSPVLLIVHSCILPFIRRATNV